MYLNDVIVVSRTLQEHLVNLRKVSQRFRGACLILNPEKCQFSQKEVRYLGDILLLEGITTETEKLKAVREWPTVKNERETLCFLELMYVLKMVYFRFRQHYKTADQTYGEEASLPVDSRS
jgi:hypothetical protein